MPRDIRRTGRYEVDDDQVRIIDAEGRGVPHRSLAHVRRARGPALRIDAVNEGDAPALGTARRVRVAKKAAARLADVPLIAQDLLCQARQLAESGAPPEVVRLILDHVAALREGRS